MKRTSILQAATLLAVCFSALAQDTANIGGTVKDSTNAVIAGAKSRLRILKKVSLEP